VAPLSGSWQLAERREFLQLSPLLELLVRRQLRKKNKIKNQCNRNHSQYMITVVTPISVVLIKKPSGPHFDSQWEKE
jgi:hypothetical protein